MNRLCFLFMMVALYSPLKITAGTDTIVSCRDTIVCLYQSDFQINVCSPYGGHYFGPGVKDTVENTYVPFWAGTGTHTVTYKIGTYSCQVRITIIDLVKAGFISGNLQVCGDGADEIYQIPADTTAIWYYWKIAQWEDYKDSTTVPYNPIHFDNSFNGGTLQAAIRNQCGEGSGSSVQIQVMPNPIPTIKSISDTLSLMDNICKNQRLSYYAYGDFDSCKWSVQGGALPGNDTSRLVMVKWGTTSGNGLLNVAVFRNGCTGSSFRNVIIGEAVAPDPATIWLFGYNMLVCSDSTAGSYCWFQDNSVYTGVVSASGRYILPDPANKQSSYFVRTGGTSSCTSCYNDSEPFHFSEMGLDNLSKSFHVSPNPALDQLELKFSTGINPAGRILLFNQFGVQVMEKYVTSGDFQVDISRLPAGFYFIEYLSGAGDKLTSKIIKL